MLSVEWDSPEFWAMLAPWVRAVACDSYGHPKAFAVKPYECNDITWGTQFKMGDLTAVNIVGTPDKRKWKESMIERPHTDTACPLCKRPFQQSSR
jgi:hypothetical protein